MCWKEAKTRIQDADMNNEFIYSKNVHIITVTLTQSSTTYLQFLLNWPTFLELVQVRLMIPKFLCLGIVVQELS